jgi:hypothetical protein
MEGYFTELAPLIEEPINLDRLEPVLQKYHVQIVGPPFRGLQSPTDKGEANGE